jgi:hypothetical protein
MAESPEKLNPRNLVIGTDRIRTCNPIKAGRLANGILGQSDLFQTFEILIFELKAPASRGLFSVDKKPVGRRGFQN